MTEKTRWEEWAEEDETVLDRDIDDVPDYASLVKGRKDTGLGQERPGESSPPPDDGSEPSGQ